MAALTPMRINLKTKIWLTVFAIVFLFSFFILFYFPEQQGETLLNNYDKEVQNLASTVALGVSIAITYKNYDGVQQSMEFVRNDKRLQYVCMEQRDTVWNSTHQNFSIKENILVQYPENAPVGLNRYPAGSVVEKHALYASPKKSGFILLGFSTNEINISKKKIRTTSIIVSSVVLVFSILVGFWLSRIISVPVLALRNAAQKVGTGDMTQRVSISSSDEIGDLAQAFNKMVEDLSLAREELRLANNNLAATNERLQESVTDLRSAQEQLVQAEKMASLGQLTAGVAHEINNPINFVSANIQPLKDDMQDILSIVGLYDKIIMEKNLQAEFEEVMKFKSDANIDLTLGEINNLLKGMEDGAMRTAEIVKGLRNFSRLDQNVFRKADLNESIESTLTLLHSTYKNRIQIEKKYGDIPEVDCFPGQINQVLMNIVSNAIQAIPVTGSIIITTYQEGNMVKMSFRDTGTGMSDDVRRKIFDPFFTTKEVGKGTGLGLSISYGIIEKHKGKIDVFSKPGEGTEFIISIPVQQI